jgi:drug/metabolite transporter (DMT)-like permease
MKLTPRLALLLTLPPLMWAGNAVIGRLLVGQVPPMTLNWLRWALTALLLLPLVWRVFAHAAAWREVAARWPYLLAIGLLGVGLFNSLQYLALVTSTPVNVTLVNSSLTVWMLAVGWLFFGVRPTRRQALGALLGFAGVVVVLTRGQPQHLAAVQLVPGDLYTLAAIIGWAVYSWLLVQPPAHMQGTARPAWDWAALLWVQVLFGLVGASAFTGLEQALGAAPVQWSAPVLAALLYISVGASIVAYRCWGLGVAEGGPALAAIFNNLTPLFAALLSATVLAQPPQPFHAAAFVLIAAGIALNTFPGRRPRPAAGSGP